ncbi:similar to RIKEN cDNA 4921521J11 (predicted), isoform CRA_b [Rattus norvegicus]|uniref:Similar to RIKEN cDNA 4921521J11 (Predicted), isoform CRA_b n=1 Tax=Rattus norvegicus TaxID=10116 RepID=A6KFJ0_RAT|nr:similar to RIKEN cDNA 4921521J11 (predicted), isoform CRA_b [Rattus norvegicus]
MQNWTGACPVPAESPPEARNSTVSEKPGEKERRQQRAGDLLSPRTFGIQCGSVDSPGPLEPYSTANTSLERARARAHTHTHTHTHTRTHARTELCFLGAAID